MLARNSASDPNSKSSRTFTIVYGKSANIQIMRTSLDAQLAKYLRQKRGDLSYVQFAKKVGISATMVHKLENGDRHITLRKLETVMAKLKIKLGDIFPDQF